MVSTKQFQHRCSVHRFRAKAPCLPLVAIANPHPPPSSLVFLLLSSGQRYSLVRATALPLADLLPTTQATHVS